VLGEAPKRAVRDVPLAQLGGDQRLDALPHERAGLVAQQGVRLGVGHPDGALQITDEHSIGRCIEQTPEQLWDLHGVQDSVGHGGLFTPCSKKM
jgi:hypothetical protein